MNRLILLIVLTGTLFVSACVSGSTVKSLARIDREIATSVDLYKAANVSLPVVEETKRTSVYTRAYEQFFGLYVAGIDEIVLRPNGFDDLTIRSVAKDGLCATLKFRTETGEFPTSENLGAYLTDELESRSEPQLEIRIRLLAGGILNLARDLENAHSPNDFGFAISTASVCLAR